MHVMQLKSSTKPLPKTRVIERLQAPRLLLAFDTNAVEFTARFLDVCDAVARFNSQRQQLDAVQMFISSVVYGEKLLHMRQFFNPTQKGPFNESRILAMLETKKVTLLAFESKHAAKVAEELGLRYPTREQWVEAKRELYIQKLGIQHLRAQIMTNGKQCSATNDWLVAGHAQVEGHLLVTDDTGEEFTGLSDRTRLATLEEALRELAPMPPGSA